MSKETEIKPVLFEAATDIGPEFVAAYPVGTMMVHLRVAHPGYAITHAKTGMCAVPFGVNSRAEAITIARAVDEAADWSTLKLESYGNPDWGDKRDYYKAAAVVGMELARSMGCML